MANEQMSGRRLRGEKGRNQMSGRPPRTRGLRGEKGNNQILIVEDDGIIAVRLQNILEKLGYNVLGAVASGEEAIQKAGESPPDLVLMDIYLAGDMNGVEAAAAIRAKADIPMMYLTAYSDDALLRQARIPEPYGYLVKPIQDRELYATIEMALYRHKLETKLKENERWLDTTLRSIGDAVITTDRQGYVTLMNRVAEELTGWQQEEALGHDLTKVFRIISEATGELMENPVARVIREGVVIGLGNHTLLSNRDGIVIPIDDSAAPIRDDKGDIIGMVLVFRDITERRQAEKERERLNRDLVSKNKELQQIIYVASHDLRSPLVNVQGLSKELDRAFQQVCSAMNREDIPSAVKEELAPILEEDIPQATQYIRASVSKMDSLLSGLLRLSRLGRAALKFEELDMNQLVSDIATVFGFQIREANVTLQVDELPSCRGDARQINQLFSNLLDNALKYLDPARAGIIRISGRREADRVVYCVEDNGIGITPKHKDEVFEIFHRLDPAGTNGEGLGLTIARKILDRHDGRIWVESEQGKGSKFFVSLPQA